MRPFRLGLTGDFLNSAGQLAYGDIRLDLLTGVPHVVYHFLREQAPTTGDPEFWSRLYSLEITSDQIRNLDGLIVLRPRVPSTAFAGGCENLCVIGRSGAGYDKIDLAACTASGVAVFNAPLALNHSTASSALLFILALAKKLLAQHRITQEGRWECQSDVLGDEIVGRTLGIVGLGHSGRELVRLVAPFRMRLIAFSPHALPEQAAELGVRLTTLDEVMSDSDFVSIHARLSPETRGLIRAPQLARMKRSAYLINVARGEIVDQAALVRALQERAIAGAALDVFEREPLPRDDPLTSLDNVILAPHWSCSTSDVWLATGEAMVRGMLRAAAGEAPPNVVNPEVLARPIFRDKLNRFRVNRSEDPREVV